MSEWRDFSPAPRPKGMRKRADKACYLNAFRIVMDRRYPEFVYAEGLAWCGFGPIHHAWVVDPDGNAVDPTWQQPGDRYWGRVLSIRAGELVCPGGPSLPIPEAMAHMEAAVSEQAAADVVAAVLEPAA
jgi:hypothetical protein